MKRILMGMAAVAAMAVAQAHAMSLADASGKVDEAINNPAAMTDIVKQLAPADQTAFLAKANAAIGNLPGSPEEKAAKYLDANKAAIKGSSKENRAAMLAETFATVPPEALTVINERFAADLCDRNADPAKPISDDAMKALAVDTMQKIQARNEGNDNASVRDAFAALMFIRASKGTPEDLRDALTQGLPTQEARDLAKDEWFPAALGEGREQSYEPMLAAADAGKMPAMDDVYKLSLADNTVPTGVLLSDLSSTVDSKGNATATYSSMFLDNSKYALPANMSQSGLNTVPRTLDTSKTWYSGYRRGGGFKGSASAASSGDSGGESRPYPYQTTR